MPEEYLGTVMGDLQARRGKVTELGERGSQRAITAHVPLASMFGYATSVRSISQGRASHSMEFDHYDPLPPHLIEEALGLRRQSY